MASTTGKVRGGARTHLPARVILDSNLIQRVNVEELRAALPVSLGLNDDSIFMFPALVSNGGLDAYYTRMSARTLANFAAALQGGVAFLDSHNTGRLPVGYSYSGQLVDYADAQGRGQAGVVGMFYITRGIRFGAGHSYATTDDYIRAIESSTVRDVSVGAYGGKWTCDICGQEYWSGQCSHILGMTYETDGGLTVATLTIDDAELSEVSAVYDGATPGAAILKVEQRMKRGLLNGDDQDAIERQLGIRFAPLPLSPDGLSIPQTRSSSMTLTLQDDPQADGATSVTETVEQDVTTDDAADVVEVVITNAVDPVVQEIDAELNALRTLAGQGVNATRADVLRSIRDKLQTSSDTLAQREREVNELRQQVADLGPLAEDGRTYRQDLIEETVSEGARAMGDSFPENVYRNMLAQATIEEIKQVRQSFVEKSATLFPGGRQTIANAKPNVPAPDKAGRKRTPAEAYTV